jgi:hypothetical protein
MILVKVLKRKDAASVLVAIVIAMIISQPLSTSTISLASKIAGNNGGQFGYSGGGWKDEYLFPVVWALLQLVVLEILAWVCVLGPMLAKKTKR